MRKYWLILAILFIPLAALALDSGAERKAAAGDYAVTTGLSTQFGRLAAAGDYLTGGDGGTVASPAISDNGFTVLMLRRLFK